MEWLIENSVILWIIISIIVIRILFKVFKKAMMIAIAIGVLTFVGITPMDVINDVKGKIVSEENKDTSVDKSAILWHIESEGKEPTLYLFDKIPIKLSEKDS